MWLPKCMLVYRWTIILACLAGLFIKTGLYDGEFQGYTFVYYTNLSNALVAATFLVAVLWKNAKTCQRFLRMKGGVMGAIVLTGLIYHFILLSHFPEFRGTSPADSLGNVLLHYVSPVMVVLDWILWDKKGVYCIKDAFLWPILPYLYFIFTIIHAKWGGGIPGQHSRYPYAFIDIDLYGWGAVIKNVLLIHVFFLLLSLLFIFIDRRLVRYSKARRER